jgi:hypothetical protein
MNDLTVPQSTELANVDALLQQKAAALAKNVKTGGSTISLRDKKFNLPSGEIVDGDLDLVILDYRYQNKYYTKPWNPKVPEAPECWAIAEAESDLSPSDNVVDKQSEDCASCPMNVFGSKGDGKACRNTMTLAVMFPDLADGDSVMTISVSPTAKKDIAAYLVKAAQMFGHPVKAITRFSLIDAARGFKIKAHAIEPNENYAVHAGYLKQAEDAVTVEPQPVPQEEEVQASVKAPVSTRRRSRAA